MNFFILTNPQAGSLYETRFDEEDLTTGDVTRKCPVCGDGVGSREWLQPRRVNITCYGKKLGDFVLSTGEGFFVSERFRQAWLSEHLKGIDAFEPIEINRVRPARIRYQQIRYWYVIPRLIPGAIDLNRSHLVMDGTPECSACRGSAIINGIAGIVLNQSALAGEDLFTPLNLPGNLVVTERFADMIHRYGLTNMVMIPVEQYIWDPLHKIVPYSKHKN